MPLHPSEKKLRRLVIGKNLIDLMRVPPFQGNLSRDTHLEGLSKAAGIGNDMHELCQHLRRKGQPVARMEQSGEQRTRGGVVRVFKNFGCDEKASVDPVCQERPSSISPSTSSSCESGHSTFLTLTGEISNTLRPVAGTRPLRACNRSVRENNNSSC